MLLKAGELERSGAEKRFEKKSKKRFDKSKKGAKLKPRCA